MRAIEQLANLEARIGEATQNIELIDHAINRLEALLRVGGAADGHAPPPPGSNRERCARWVVPTSARRHAWRARSTAGPK